MKIKTNTYTMIEIVLGSLVMQCQEFKLSGLAIIGVIVIGN
jgi:hypothetical protein